MHNEPLKSVKIIKVVFCLPGDNFSGRFMDCWSNTLLYCLNNGIQPLLSRRESPNIYFVRNMCLGGDVLRGKGQKPFNGQIEYDYIMWIDSDIIFRAEQIRELISHDKDIVSGIYLMADGRHLAACRDWDEEYFKKHGSFEFLTLKALEGQAALMEVAYTGLGFMLVKKGVFEKLEYPWFSPRNLTIGNASDFCSEDVGFCLKAKDVGFKIYIDPRIKVGHEKKLMV
jgi:hypothetical protein